MIEVVSAVIVRAGRIFLTQRKPTSDFPLDWESPGGMVEVGENHVTALLRELHEELAFGFGVVGPEPIKTVVRVPIFETEFCVPSRRSSLTSWTSRFRAARAS